MNVKCLIRSLILLAPLMAWEQSGSAQTMLSNLQTKKSLWRAIVDKKLDGVKGWDAGFPTERTVDRSIATTFGAGGDSLMYNALLCGTGEGIACGVIPNSLEDSGQLRRNPLVKNIPSTSKYGPLSKDHTMATLYWLSLPDSAVPRETKRNFALNWQKSFNTQITTALECDQKKEAYCLTSGGRDAFDSMIENSGYDVSAYVPGQNTGFNLDVKLPPLSTETLGKAAKNIAVNADKLVENIKNQANGGLGETLETLKVYLKKGAADLQSCLASDKDVEKCVKTNINGSADYLKGWVAAVSMCADGLKQGVAEKDLEESQLGRCVANLIATVLTLPRFCNDINCVMPPVQMAYVNKIWTRLDLKPPFSSFYFDYLGIDSEDVSLYFSKFDNMNEANLTAMNILVRRNLGLKTSRISGRLLNRQPNNAFFQAISNDPKYTKEAVAGLLINQCRSIESVRNGKPQYLLGRFQAPEGSGLENFDMESFWRWKTPEQDQFEPDANNRSEKISMVWDCILVANLLGVKEFRDLSVVPSRSLTIKVKKNENPTVYDTLSLGVSGGVPPLRYELREQPSGSSYFSFDPETGVFIFRPVDAYTGVSIRFSVTDAIGRKVNSETMLSFDHSTIYPGHPPLTLPPERPLPAAVNPLFRITHLESNQVRELNDASVGPADLLLVKSGKLDISAEAFIENVDQDYSGNLDCTLDWTSKGAVPALIKDTDEYPRNFFIQKSVDVTSLDPYDVTIFRMNCLAPDMPIVVRDIPVVYVPDAAPLKKSLDKTDYTYASTRGAALKLTLNKSASNEFNRVFAYSLKTAECGSRDGVLVAATNVNKLTLDGSYEGLMVNGDAQTLAWINAPVCNRTDPVVWKLVSSSTVSSESQSGDKMDGSCQYKHKKDTAGGKSGQISLLDAFGKSKACDKNGDWKTSCKDGNGDTEEVGCDKSLPTPKPSEMGMCRYKHKKDTAGGKSGEITGLDALGKSKSCDKNGDWKTSCKDGKGETDEVACQ